MPVRRVLRHEGKVIDCQTLNKTVRLMLSAYRSRAATRWDEQREEHTFSESTGHDAGFIGPRDAAVDFSEGNDAFGGAGRQSGDNWKELQRIGIFNESCV